MRWVIALGVLTVLIAATSVGLLVAEAGLVVETNTYWAQFDFSQPVETDPVEDAYYTGLSNLAYRLGQVGDALLGVAVAAGFVLLGVISRRWDSRDQVDATAAS